MTSKQRLQVDAVAAFLRARPRTWVQVRQAPGNDAVYIDYGSVLSDGTEERAIGTVRVDPDGGETRVAHT